MKYICNLKGEITLYPTDPKVGFHVDSISLADSAT